MGVGGQLEDALFELVCQPALPRPSSIVLALAKEPSGIPAPRARSDDPDRATSVARTQAGVRLVSTRV